MAKRKTPEQWPEWFRRAWNEVRPDADGNRDIEKVKELAAKYVKEDETETDQMADARVGDIVRELSRGVTQPITGKMALPGLEPEPWRPDQIYVSEGKTVRAADAKPLMVARKAELVMADAKQKVAAAERIQKRSNLYSQWFTEQVQEGRDVRTLNQQVWLDESGYLTGD